MDATLLTRTTEFLSDRVDTIHLQDTISEEIIKLTSGTYANFTVAKDTSGLRTVNTVTIDLQPPADGCSDPYGLNVVRRINNKTGTPDGDFYLDTDDCLHVVPSLDERNTLALSQECEPCVLCEDYVQLYTALQELWRELSIIIQKYMCISDAYNETLGLVTAYVSTLNEPSMTLQLATAGADRITLYFVVCTGAYHLMDLSYAINYDITPPATYTVNEVANSAFIRKPQSSELLPITDPSPEVSGTFTPVTEVQGCTGFIMTVQLTPPPITMPLTVVTVDVIANVRDNDGNTHTFNLSANATVGS